MSGDEELQVILSKSQAFSQKGETLGPDKAGSYDGHLTKYVSFHARDLLLAGAR